MSPHDRVRLARAFGVRLTRPVAGLVTAAAVGLVMGPLGWISLVPAGLIASGVGGMLVADRRRIERMLGELEPWGFPVSGYREWLLAEAPTFEIELRREAGVDVVADAVAAVDSVAVVSRRAPCVIRVATPRIELPPSRRHPAAVRVGDRRLLFELYDRVLAPLHADVGIVAMRMGDYMTLGTLVPVRRPAGGEAFREQALAAPPALQALVAAGTTALVPPSEARALPAREDRVLIAAGERPAGVTMVSLIGGAAMVAGGLAGGWLVAAAGAAAGVVGGLVAMTASNRRRAGAAAVVTGYEFPVEGYDDWLLSGRPILDVELSAPGDRGWVAEQTAGLDWDLAWIDDRLLRIETWPRLVTTASSALPPFWGGNPPVFRAIVKRVIAPLHRRVGVVAVRMGGYVDRRG